MKESSFVFTGVVYREGEGYSSLCPELDVASEGDTPEEAEKALFEAVTLYLETAFEANLPHMRPLPPEEDPRNASPGLVVKIFALKVDFQIRAHA